jgi:hypothetical protein
MPASVVGQVRVAICTCHIDAHSFTVATLTATGFGDITITTTVGKLLSVFIMVVDVAFLVSLARAIFQPSKTQYSCPACGWNGTNPIRFIAITAGSRLWSRLRAVIGHVHGDESRSGPRSNIRLKVEIMGAGDTCPKKPVWTQIAKSTLRNTRASLPLPSAKPVAAMAYMTGHAT